MFGDGDVFEEGKEEKKSGFWGWLGAKEDEKKKKAAESARSRSTTTRAPLALDVVEELGNENDREPFCKDVEDLEQFLTLQRANGKWLNDAPFISFLTKKIGIERQDIVSPPKRLKHMPQQAQMDAWATALAVQTLIIHFEDVEPTWAGMVAKSKGFLFRMMKKSSPPKSTVASIAQEAKSLLEAAVAVVGIEEEEEEEYEEYEED